MQKAARSPGWGRPSLPNHRNLRPGPTLLTHHTITHTTPSHTRPSLSLFNRTRNSAARRPAPICLTRTLKEHSGSHPAPGGADPTMQGGTRAHESSSALLPRALQSMRVTQYENPLWGYALGHTWCGVSCGCLFKSVISNQYAATTPLAQTHISSHHSGAQAAPAAAAVSCCAVVRISVAAAVIATEMRIECIAPWCARPGRRDSAATGSSHSSGQCTRE